MLYIKVCIKQKKGGIVDEKVLEWRKRYAKFDLDDKEMKVLKDICKEVVKEQKEYKEEVRQNKEEHIIELFLYKITNDTEDNKKRRKKALKNIEKIQYR